MPRNQRGISNRFETDTPFGGSRSPGVLVHEKAMTQIHKKLLIASFIMLCLPKIILANGAIFLRGLQGEGVVPMKESAVRLSEENVEIDVETEKVKCHFVLVNTSNARRQFLMGFPFKGDYNEYDGKGSPPDFFKVFVGGREVKSKLEKSTAYSYVYTWDMTLESKQEVVVTCEYALVWKRSGGSAEPDIQSINYITHTGGLWSGNIAKATFKIIFDSNVDPPTNAYIDQERMPNYVSTWLVKTELKPKGYSWDSENNTATYEYKNWKPSSSDDITYSITTYEADSGEYFKYKSYEGDKVLYKKELLLPDFSDVLNLRVGTCVDGDCENEPRPSKRQININLNSYLQNYLRRLRNEIFARHGYIFKDPTLRQFYSQYPWYKSNPEFKMESLNKFEKENVTLILAAEKDAANEYNKLLSGNSH